MREINPAGLDAYKPTEIALQVEQVGEAKARLSLVPLLTLAILAGVFIALGGAAYTMAMIGMDVSFGPARVLGGVVFSMGLILVVVGGAELFTGNALMVMATVDRKISVSDLCRNWSFVYLGNFLGALAVALAIYLADYRFCRSWVGAFGGQYVPAASKYSRWRRSQRLRFDREPPVCDTW